MARGAPHCERRCAFLSCDPGSLKADPSLKNGSVGNYEANPPGEVDSGGREE